MLKGINAQRRTSISASTGRENHEANPTAYSTPTVYHTFVPKADKFRTVPCKYYHRYFLTNLAILVVTKLIIAHIFMTKGMQAFLFLLIIPETTSQCLNNLPIILRIECSHILGTICPECLLISLLKGRIKLSQVLLFQTWLWETIRIQQGFILIQEIMVAT